MDSRYLYKDKIFLGKMGLFAQKNDDIFCKVHNKNACRGQVRIPKTGWGGGAIFCTILIYK